MYLIFFSNSASGLIQFLPIHRMLYEFDMYCFTIPSHIQYKEYLWQIIVTCYIRISDIILNILIFTCFRNRLRIWAKNRDWKWDTSVTWWRWLRCRYFTTFIKTGHWCTGSENSWYFVFFVSFPLCLISKSRKVSFQLVIFSKFKFVS